LLQESGINKDVKEIAFGELKNKIKGKETGLRWANVAAMIAEKAAAGPVMWIILAIIAVVAALTAAFIALFKFLSANSTEGRLNAENEKLEKLNENLKSA
jgi:hypothetical protein